MNNKETEKSVRELVLAVRSGDDGAFRTLAERYAGMLTSQASSFYASISATDPSASDLSKEDLRQEAQIALLRAARTYDPDGKSGVTFGLYAKICVRNALISLFRKSRTRKKRYQRAGGKKGIAASSPETADGTDYSDLLERVGAGLTSYERSVLEAHVGGSSPRDIAAQLDRPVKSVYNALFRVKTKIRNTIE